MRLTTLSTFFGWSVVKHSHDGQLYLKHKNSPTVSAGDTLEQAIDEGVYHFSADETVVFGSESPTMQWLTAVRDAAEAQILSSGEVRA